MICRRNGTRISRPTRITLTAVNFSPTSIKKQVADVSLTLPLAHMSTLHEIIHENVREGELYEKLDRNWVRCFACGHCCKIPEGQPGVCKVRYNRGGTLFVPWGYVGGIRSLILRGYLRPANRARKVKARPWPPAKEPKLGASTLLTTRSGFRRSKMFTASTRAAQR